MPNYSEILAFEKLRISRVPQNPKLLQTVFLGTINCNYRYRIVLQETETDLWER